MGGATRHHRHHGQSKGESKVIPLKYIKKNFSYQNKNIFAFLFLELV
jgi:hypothetical protein